MNQKPIPEIPESEFLITYARSGGPGGQNVNKRETKAVVKWHVRDSKLFTDEQKTMIEQLVANRLSKEGYIVVDADALRSREQNRVNAIETLRRLVRDALTPEEERIPTKPTRASKRRRLDDKTRRGSVKANRQKRWDE